MIEETLWALEGLLLASESGHAALQSTLWPVVTTLAAHAYATSRSIDRDAYDVRALAIILVKQLTFGKGQSGDSRGPYPHDHRPVLDVGSLDQRQSTVSSLLHQALRPEGNWICEYARVEDLLQAIFGDVD